jgi:hypothetical protein
MNAATPPKTVSAKQPIDLTKLGVGVAVSNLLSPSYFMNFAKLSPSGDALAGLILARGARRFGSKFPSVSAFVAIV